MVFYVGDLDRFFRGEDILVKIKMIESVVSGIEEIVSVKVLR